MDTIKKYIQLIKHQPQLFASRTNRKIITEEAVLNKYSSENKQNLGLLAETKYAYFIVDLVEAILSDGNNYLFPYQRLILKKQMNGANNSVVFGLIENQADEATKYVVFVWQERHATGRFHLELPRGFGELGLSGEENALKELREETGYIGSKAILMGQSFTDTGIMDGFVSYYYVKIEQKTKARPEFEEAIAEVKLLKLEELPKLISQRKITDGFTIQAYCFYRLFRKTLQI